jgi:hypothetical protein
VKVLGGIALVALFVVVLWFMAPVVADHKQKCDDLHGFYNYKTNQCFYSGGIKTMGWDW